MPRPLLFLFLGLASFPAASGIAAEPAAPDPMATALAKFRSDRATYADWEAVVAIGKPAIPALEKLLADPSDPVQARAAVVLYRLGEASALDKLAALLESRDEDARSEAAGALRAFVGEPQGFDPAAPDAERAKALQPWNAWWKANREEALKIVPMSRLSARVLSVDRAAGLAAMGLAARHGARRGMQLNVARAGGPVCLVEIVAPGAEASVARIVPLSERQPPRIGDRAFWIAK